MSRLDTKQLRESFGLDVPPRDYETRSQLTMRALCAHIEALERTLRDLEPVLDSAVSAACAKAPPDYAETADALDAVRAALEGDE